jgi:hypothetical protein
VKKGCKLLDRLIKVGSERERERSARVQQFERERVCVCVCVWVRESLRERVYVVCVEWQ